MATSFDLNLRENLRSFILRTSTNN
jgi:choline kinase